MFIVTILNCYGYVISTYQVDTETLAEECVYDAIAQGYDAYYE